MEIERLLPILIAAIVFVLSVLVRRGWQRGESPTATPEVTNPQPRSENRELDARSPEEAPLPETARTPDQRVAGGERIPLGTPPPRPCPSSRQVVRRLLREPAGARTAILLSEVLRPPMSLRSHGDSS